MKIFRLSENRDTTIVHNSKQCCFQSRPTDNRQFSLQTGEKGKPGTNQLKKHQLQSVTKMSDIAGPSTSQAAE